MVPREGLEPSQPCGHSALNAARLPVPPPRPRSSAAHVISRGRSVRIIAKHGCSVHNDIGICPTAQVWNGEYRYFSRRRRSRTFIHSSRVTDERRIRRKNATRRPPEASTPTAQAPMMSHVSKGLSSPGKTSSGTFVETFPRGPETSSVNVHCPSRPTGMRTSKWLNPGSTVWGWKGPTVVPAGPSP